MTPERPMASRNSRAVRTVGSGSFALAMAILPPSEIRADARPDSGSDDSPNAKHRGSAGIPGWPARHGMRPGHEHRAGLDLETSASILIIATVSRQDD